MNPTHQDQQDASYTENPGKKINRIGIIKGSTQPRRRRTCSQEPGGSPLAGGSGTTEQSNPVNGDGGEQEAPCERPEESKTQTRTRNQAPVGWRASPRLFFFPVFPLSFPFLFFSFFCGFRLGDPSIYGTGFYSPAGFLLYVWLATLGFRWSNLYIGSLEARV